jgi:hypothetical protein
MQVLGRRSPPAGTPTLGESVDAGPSLPFNFAMNSVGVLDAGFCEIGIDCRDTSLPAGA